MLWVPWFRSLTFLRTFLGKLSSESTWLQQTVSSSLTKECKKQCARGPGAFSRSGKILPGCLGGLNFRILAARNRDRSGVHDG